MNAATATPPATPARSTQALAEHLRNTLRSNARRWQRLLLLEGIGLGVSVPLAYLWLFILLDNALHLPVWGRVLACLGLLGLAGGLAYRLFQKARRLSLSEDQVALAIEHQTLGSLDNRLINALQLARGAAIGPADLREATVVENCTRLEKVRLPRPASARPALLKLGLALGLIALGLVFWLRLPDHFSSSASRLFLPFANIDPIYRTRLEVEPGNVEAAGDVPIVIHIHGERPKSLTLTRKSNGQRQVETIPVDASSEAVTYTFLGVQQSLTYTVRANDFTTPIYRIDVPPQPRLSLVRVRWDYPAYTRKPALTTERASGDLEALRGTQAQVTFVFDRPLTEAFLMLEKVGLREPQRTPLERVSATEYQSTLTFEGLAGYLLEIHLDGGREPQQIGSFDLRVLTDQSPRMQLTGLEQVSDVAVDGVLPVKVQTTDDYGLEKVGLFVRQAAAGEQPGDNKSGPPWQEIIVWPAEGKLDLGRNHQLSLTALGASEGDRLEIALRAVDTDPLKKGEWLLGPVHRLTVGGEGAALQRQYEQILRGEEALQRLIDGQKKAAEGAAGEMKQFDPGNGLRLDDPRTLDPIHARIREHARAQNSLRDSASQAARDMLPEAGNVRVGLGLLADTEMVRAIRILETIPTREEPQAKRAALGDARLTGERIVRSLQEMLEQLRSFRRDWEMTNAIPFVQMLAERQHRLRELSRQQTEKTSGAAALNQSAGRRQRKLAELCRLIQPAFTGVGERLKPVDAVLAQEFTRAADVLGGADLQEQLKLSADAAEAGRWAEALPLQEKAERTLAALHSRLRQAQTEAAQRALAAIKQKAESDLETQKELEKLQQGLAENKIVTPDKMKLEDIIHTRESAGDGKKHDPAKKMDPENYLFPDSKMGMLNPKDTGTRQDFNALKLAESPSGTPSFPKQSDRKANQVNAPIQEKFEDLVGKLLEEADEIQKKYETYNINTSFNINEPGAVGKQAGDMNSTAASAATGNMKPPTSNVGGASRSGRQGARAHGLVVGDESINRRGRDKVQEGQEKVADQAGTLKEKKSDDPQKDTSTEFGGKKVDSDDTKFSLADAGKWKDDILKHMGKPQAKNSIVERQDGRMDPRLAELMRDLTSKQEQMIERAKTIRKELRNLYLPTEHLDDLLLRMSANLESLKELPDPELFRAQQRLLEELRNTIQVFQSPLSGFQPSLPRERTIRGRVLDEPARPTIPGYEEAVKRYYEKLSAR